MVKLMAVASDLFFVNWQFFISVAATDIPVDNAANKLRLF
jgi:hypothetical protein